MNLFFAQVGNRNGCMMHGNLIESAGRDKVCRREEDARLNIWSMYLRGDSLDTCQEVTL